MATNNGKTPPNSVIFTGDVHGLTLDTDWRKEYKKAALTSPWRPAEQPNGSTCNEIATWAGEMADAMLAEDVQHEKEQANAK